MCAQIETVERKKKNKLASKHFDSVSHTPLPSIWFGLVWLAIIIPYYDFFFQSGNEFGDDYNRKNA